MHSVGDAFAAGQGRFIAPLGRRKEPATATADNAAAEVDDAAAKVDDAAAGIAAASASGQRLVDAVAGAATEPRPELPRCRPRCGPGRTELLICLTYFLRNSLATRFSVTMLTPMLIAGHPPPFDRHVPIHKAYGEKHRS